MKMTEFDI